MKIGRLLLRLVVGGLFVGHGTQKLFGWFQGHGLDATAQGSSSSACARGGATRSQPARPRRAVAHCSRSGSRRPLPQQSYRDDADRDPQGARQERSVGHQRRLRVQPGPDRGSARAGRGRARRALAGCPARPRAFRARWALAALAAGALGAFGSYAAAAAQPAAPEDTAQTATTDAGAAEAGATEAGAPTGGEDAN